MMDKLATVVCDSDQYRSDNSSQDLETSVQRSGDTQHFLSAALAPGLRTLFPPVTSDNLPEDIRGLLNRLDGLCPPHLPELMTPDKIPQT
jgi:hypothetical protein